MRYPPRRASANEYTYRSQVTTTASPCVTADANSPKRNIVLAGVDRHQFQH